MQNLGLHVAVKAHDPFLKRLRDLFRSVKTIDHLMIFVAILYPLTALPQILKLHETGDVGSISLLSLVLKFVFALPWIYYGFLHKSKPVIYTNILWCLGYVVLILQVFIY